MAFGRNSEAYQAFVEALEAKGAKLTFWKVRQPVSTNDQGVVDMRIMMPDMPERIVRRIAPLTLDEAGAYEAIVQELFPE
jgi:hypothetical protein